MQVRLSVRVGHAAPGCRTGLSYEIEFHYKPRAFSASEACHTAARLSILPPQPSTPPSHTHTLSLSHVSFAPCPHPPRTLSSLSLAPPSTVDRPTFSAVPPLFTPTPTSLHPPPHLSPLTSTYTRDHIAPQLVPDPTAVSTSMCTAWFSFFRGGLLFFFVSLSLRDNSSVGGRRRIKGRESVEARTGRPTGRLNSTWSVSPSTWGGYLWYAERSLAFHPLTHPHI